MSLAPSALFQHGVASGDPLQNRVILWTRLTTPDAAAPVTYEVATDPAFTALVAQGQAEAHASADHTVHVEPLAWPPTPSTTTASKPRVKPPPLGAPAPCQGLASAICASPKPPVASSTPASSTPTLPWRPATTCIFCCTWAITSTKPPTRRPPAKPQAPTSAGPLSPCMSAKPWPTTAPATTNTTAIPTCRPCMPPSP